MEDFKIDIMIESGQMRELCSNLNPFTLIGADTFWTSAPMRARFFSTTILYRGTIDYNCWKKCIDTENAYRWKLLSKLQVEVGEHRVADALLRRVRDFAQIKEMEQSILK
jgi:Holliday junction DNA helicase RuvB